MSSYNYQKLLGKMKEKGYTQEQLAQRIGISPCTLNLKLNNKNDFRQDEILSISKELGIPGERFEEYFFAH